MKCNAFCPSGLDEADGQTVLSVEHVGEESLAAELEPRHELEGGSKGLGPECFYPQPGMPERWVQVRL